MLPAKAEKGFCVQDGGGNGHEYYSSLRGRITVLSAKGGNGSCISTVLEIFIPNGSQNQRLPPTKYNFVLGLPLSITGGCYIQFQNAQWLLW